MKLVDLEPRWIHESIFAFRCPHCSAIWLTCKGVAMSMHEQMLIAEGALRDEPDARRLAVLCNQSMAWTINGRDFATMTVTPSLDASKSGHWHGFITNGEIR